MSIETRSLFLVGGMLALLYSGCQVPPYSLPGGYSSTYHRGLQAVEVPLPPVPGPVSPELVGREIPQTKAAGAEVGVFYPPTFQYDPPTKSTLPQAVILPDDRPANANAAAQQRRTY